MTDTIRYNLKLLELTGSLDESDHAAYVRQLVAVLACDQSDGHSRKWARAWLEEIKCQHEMLARLNQVPAAV